MVMMTLEGLKYLFENQDLAHPRTEECRDGTV